MKDIQTKVDMLEMVGFDTHLENDMGQYRLYMWRDSAGIKDDKNVIQIYHSSLVELDVSGIIDEFLDEFKFRCKHTEFGID